MDEHKRYCKNCGGEIRAGPNYCSQSLRIFATEAERKPKIAANRGLYIRARQRKEENSFS